MQRFTPLLIGAARPCRHALGCRWLVDETYVKIAGRWRYVYRAVECDGQVVDVFVSRRCNIAAASKFFAAALAAHGEPDEIVTDLAPALEQAIEKVLPDAFHNTEQCANNRVECDHGRLKAAPLRWPRPTSRPVSNGRFRAVNRHEMCGDVVSAVAVGTIRPVR